METFIFSEGKRGGFYMVTPGGWDLDGWCGTVLCPPVPCSTNWLWGLRRQRWRGSHISNFQVAHYLTPTVSLKSFYLQTIKKVTQDEEKGFVLSSTYNMVLRLLPHVNSHGDSQWWEKRQRYQELSGQWWCLPPYSTQQLLT